MKINSLLPLLAALLCMVSFAWGMLWHFQRIGKPSRAMLVTSLLAGASAALQLHALDSRHLRFPIAALPLYGMSAILFWWAVGATRGKLAACGQGAVSREIVIDGPHRYIRHPFYLSYNLTWIAGFVATGWWPLAISAIVMAALYERAAREEELDFATSPLAGEYTAYRQNTGKYLPRLRLGERPHHPSPNKFV